MVVQVALVHSRLSIEVEAAADAGSADVRTAQRNLDVAVRREQLGQTVPLEGGQVVAIAHLQILELLEILQQSQPVLQVVGGLLQAGEIQRGGGG